MHQALVDGAPQHLWKHLHALQRRLWLHHALAGALSGLALGAGIGVVLVLATLWAAREPTWLQPPLVAGGLALVVLLATLLQGPSTQEAALAADSRLGLEERLSTALEILEGRLASSMAARQLEDAWRAVQGQPIERVSSLRALRRSGLVSGVLGLLFMAGLLVASHVDPANNPVSALRERLEEAIARSGLLAQSPVRLPTLSEQEGEEPFSVQPRAPLINPQTEEQLREQTARSRNQQAALSRLAEALTGTAAAREIGEQLQRGNYGQASSNLRRLARENDQLSGQAKAELAEALRQAAGETRELSPQLAQQEEAAAQALSARDYRATQQALERLGQGVSDASSQIVSQQELAQAWQRLQEERLGQSQATLEGGGQSSSSSEGQLQVSQSGGAMGGLGVMTEGDPEAGDLLPGTTGGPGMNAGNFNPNAKPTRLNVAGKEVVIEGLPSGAGDGKGGDGANTPAVSVQTAEESGALLEGIPQPTDPVRDAAERTSIPLGHLRAVHDYFQPGDRPQ